MWLVIRRYIGILTIIINFPYCTCINSFFGSSCHTSLFIFKMFFRSYIIESVDSINRDERGFPLTQYITNGGISRLGTLSRILNTTIVFCGGFSIE